MSDLTERASAAPWGVAALLLATGDALAARFGAVRVRGELSGFTRAASGHCYFSLKDSDGAPGLLRCAMFRRAATLLDFAPAEGHQIELRGRLAVYEPRGELQLVVEAMRRVGSGTLYEEFLRLRQRLQDQGLFAAERKRSLPPQPQRLGVVTSPSAAALHDVLTALSRRAPHVGVVIYPCLVQGVEAPPSSVAALAAANLRHEVDALLLVRGGGSLEDLWAFNDERVVRAVAASALPVVCGVGHETDITLADLAADLRAPTPTAAAELAAPAREAMLLHLQGQWRQLLAAQQRLLQRQAQRLDRAAMRLAAPAALLATQKRQLALLQARLAHAVGLRQQSASDGLQVLARRWQRVRGQMWPRERLRLGGWQARLQALDPARVLQRGYAWVEDEKGQPVISAAQLQTGQQVQGVWADGRAALEVRTRSLTRKSEGPGGA